MRFMVQARGALAATLTVTMMFGVCAATRLAAQQPAKAKLGPEHELLKGTEGTWDAVIKSPVGDSKGTLTCQVGLDGLWLLDHFKGEFAGKPYEGRGATSYDAGKKKYVAVGIDSVTASPAVAEGDFDKTTKTMTLVGDLPLPNGKSMKGTKVFTYPDANTMTYTLTAVLPNGKSFELMKTTYTRRPK
jgi:hypothetical protein